MQQTRPRPISLNISTTCPVPWRAILPPTPRHATYPSMSALINAKNEVPPVPPLSYWDPETPSPFASTSSEVSPSSPMNPFLAPPKSPTEQQHLFPKAAPLLPASPLSIFDSPLSPTAVTFLRTPTPSPTKATFLLPASPDLSPRFLLPRSPPPCTTGKRKVSVYDVVKDIAERKGSVASMVRMQEMIKSEFYQSLFLKRQKEIDGYSGNRKKGERTKWTIKGIWGRLTGGRNYREVAGKNRTVQGADRIKISRPHSLLSRVQSLLEISIIYDVPSVSSGVS